MLIIRRPTDYAGSKTMKGTLVAVALAAMIPAYSQSPSLPFADAHVHLSMGSARDLERLLDAGITAVRDCGGDVAQLTQWRDAIAAGTPTRTAHLHRRTDAGRSQARRAVPHHGEDA